MHASHHRVLCPKCKGVVSQCRCPEKSKTEEVAKEPCPSCRASAPRPLTDEDLTEIERSAALAEQRAPRMSIAVLKLDVDKLVAEVRRLQSRVTELEDARGDGV